MQKQIYTVLIVDDEPDILEFISYALQKDGFNVQTALNGHDAISCAMKGEPPDIVLLDVMMPGMDGIETCREIRALPGLKDVVVIFLSARNEDYSQIAGFEVGADDYIIKPVHPRVLASRLRAMIRRRKRVTGETSGFTPDGVYIDREKFQVRKGNQKIELRKKEFELLALLAEKPGKVFTRDEILFAVWGNGIVVGGRTVDVHVNKLREKLGASLIRTVKGVGYRYDPE